MEKQSVPEISNSLNTKIDWSKRKKIFYLFLYICVFNNFDTGVIPAAVSNLQEDLNLDKVQVAALGSLPFFGVCIASIIVSVTIKKFTVKKTLFITLLLNLLFCVLFAMTSNLAILYIARLGMGFTQAFWVIYGPVWTNVFSPLKSHTTWLGILQGFSPLGIMVGYIAAGILVQNWEVVYSWRFAFIFQGVCEFPILFLIPLIDDNDFDVLKAKAETTESATEIDSEAPIEIKLSSFSDLIKDFKVIIKNYLFMFQTMSVCVAFFVVFSIQFWGTVYINEVLEESPTNSMIIYAFLTITAPILGVFFGGFVSDKLGGYKGENVFNTLKLCLAFSIVCVFVAIPSGFVFKAYFWAPLLWVQVFFGACNIPPSTGVVVNSVSREYQTSASALSQMIYNILAYFSAPLFSAAIMDSFHDKKEGMLWGFRCTQFLSIFGVIFICLAIYCYKKFYIVQLKKVEKEYGKRDSFQKKKSLDLVYNTDFRPRSWSII